MPNLFLVVDEGDEQAGAGFSIRKPRFSRHPPPRTISSTITKTSSMSTKGEGSPSTVTEHEDEEVWSGDDDIQDDGHRRKRLKTQPISVSCEKCKERKVSRKLLR